MFWVRFFMDPSSWLGRDDVDIIGNGRSPGEIFGISCEQHPDYMKDRIEGHMINSPSVINDCELTSHDYKDLEMLLEHHNTPGSQENALPCIPITHSMTSTSSNYNNNHSKKCKSTEFEFYSNSNSSFVNNYSGPDVSATSYFPKCNKCSIINSRIPTACAMTENTDDGVFLNDIFHESYPFTNTDQYISQNKYPAKPLTSTKMHRNTNNDESTKSFTKELIHGTFPYDEVLDIPNTSPISDLYNDGFTTSSWSANTSLTDGYTPASDPFTEETNNSMKLSAKCRSESSLPMCYPSQSTVTANTNFRSISLSDVFYCQYCGREFKHKIGLKNHERSHLRGESHTCGYCGKKFRYKNKLRRHENVHAREMRICRFCGIVQSNDYELVQHEKQHKKKVQSVHYNNPESKSFQHKPTIGLEVLAKDTIPAQNTPWIT